MFVHDFDRSSLRTAIALLVLAWIVLGCGGGSGSNDAATGDPLESSTDLITGQNGTGTASVSWTPDMTRADGSALVDLAGYRIHYGTFHGSYPNTIDVANPGIVEYVVENLPPGTYYFVVTQYDSAGFESDFSSEVSKTINN